MGNSEPQQALAHLWGGLRAEYEEAAWLAPVYVQPSMFRALAQPYPCLLFGESGSGKSALRLMISEEAQNDPVAPKLVVTWKPTPLRRQIPSKPVEWYLHQGLHTCAATLLHRIAQQPDRFQRTARWAQTVIADFLKLYLQGSWAHQVERLLGEVKPAAEPLLQQLMNHPISLAPDSTDEMQIMSELIAALKSMTLSGIWVMVDGLETWEERDPQGKEQFKALLSTLALFEEPGFVFKFMMPLDLRPALLASGSVLRRRLEPYTLTWSSGELMRIVLKRYAPLALPPPPFLAHLTKDREIQEWMQEQGGLTPGGWLRAAAPLVRDHANALGQQRTDEEAQMTLGIPPLRIDAETEQVFVGQRRIEAISPASYNLLHYLYERRPRLCTREELYYQAHRKLSHIPTSRYDDEWEDAKSWGGVLDTAVSRLRELIEPEKKVFRYLITVRGKGFRLENTE